MFPFNKTTQVYAAELKLHANFINSKPNAELKYQVYNFSTYIIKLFNEI